MSSHLSHPKYRPDIDGLRAIAVIAVVVFHAFPNFLKGGFIGVDIFFVISGYLISTIIFENLDRKTFSFTEFYVRRIKRIFPALVLVLIVSLAFGWFTLLDDEYRQLGLHTTAGAGFISNFILWNESGYFDNASDTKPLLHLWSLGIEEQFYIVWPLLLWLAWKFKFNLVIVTILIATVSFILNIKGVKTDIVATFYSPQTRFWELLTGSLLAWMTLFKSNTLSGSFFASIPIYKPQIKDGKRLSNFLSSAGLLLLVFGFWQISKESNFPGYWALAPVLGAAFIISAGSKAWCNHLLLSNNVVVWFGLISFPLYLWHWPLLSFARIIEGEIPNLNIRILAILLSIILAWLTYELLERRIRFGGNDKIKVILLVTLMIIVGYVGYSIYSKNGLPSRPYNQKFISYKESIKVPERSSECFEIPYAYKKPENWFCSLGKVNAPVKYFAYGDSHALSMLPALDKYAFENKLGINFTGTSGCPSLLGIQSLRGEAGIEKYNCRELNERVFNFVKHSGIKNVILINRWTYYTNSITRPSEFNPIAKDTSILVNKVSSTNDLVWAIQNTVNRYTDIGVQVIFIEDNPQQIYEPKDVLRKGRAVQDEYIKLSVSREEHRNNQKFVNEVIRNTGAKIINFDDILCNEEICPLVNNLKFLYSDDDHLSVEGSLMLYQALFDGLYN